MAKKRILVAEPGKIGKLPPQEERGSSKNDGKWGDLTDNMSSQYIKLHLMARGPISPHTSHRHIQTHLL